jgi:hypothetical protein
MLIYTLPLRVLSLYNLSVESKRQYTEFQLKIISIFEEEIISRLDKTGSKIHNEDDVMKIVDDCYEELFSAQMDIENGAVDICRPPNGTLTH